MTEIQGAHISISGIVQGVGFRPFVYNLATQMSMKGWVRNTSAGVELQVDGEPALIQGFIDALKNEAPSLARIDEIEIIEGPANGFVTFEILHSQALTDAFQPIATDVCICKDCLKELFDPSNRRYRYPFINCTNCGPRFTIIKDIPYDRPLTTMAGFPLCKECEAEYHNPLNRRFHAQPVACPTCGPEVWLEFNRGEPEAVQHRVKGDAAIQEAQRLILEGKIVAIKGLGGFHLACDALNQQAVDELRRRKLRVDKPFAIMMLDLESVTRHCFLNYAEQELLESRERPIVILKRRPDTLIVPGVTPNQDTLGIMLPYTPLHYLLMTADKVNKQNLTMPPLVMTSGNLSEEPIATRNEEALERLASLADAFLLHNRDIHIRCDDSVMRVFILSLPEEENSPDEPSSHLVPIRRSRGYAPFTVHLPWEVPPLVALGGELKNTFCITRHRYAFLSQHIGDMANYETYISFEDSITHFLKLYRILPRALACDLHPNYLATRYAKERAEREGLAAIGVQHHHAHILSCLTEHGISGDRPVIGVAFDGTGYGEDEAIWGSEFLLTDNGGPLSKEKSGPGYRRLYHLAYLPLPGGDAATHKPSRIALAYLWKAGLDWEPDLPSVAYLCAEERSVLRSQLEKGINTPLTSSMGRLFDAVSALAGVRQSVNYEAQAAIELEAIQDPYEDQAYPFEIKQDQTDGLIDPTPMIHQLVSDLLKGVPASKISARFHNGAARMVLETCQVIRHVYGISEVALSGGVWQNMSLLEKTIQLLDDAGFHVYFHNKIPTNDGGLSLGQAMAAYHRLELNDRLERTLCV